MQHLGSALLFAALAALNGCSTVAGTSDGGDGGAIDARVAPPTDGRSASDTGVTPSRDASPATDADGTPGMDAQTPGNDSGQVSPVDSGPTTAGNATLPLAVSANNRYLVGSNGAPFLIAGDAPQCLSANLSATNMDAYLAARAAQGFNAVWVNLLCTTYTGGRVDATTYDGIAPFTAMLGDGHYDLTQPNSAYFARIDALLAAAAAHGIVVFLDPIEFGGFWPTIQANSAAAATSYGRFLGARYEATPNIVWMSGNDMSGFNMVDKFVDVATGIVASGATQLQTAELDWPGLSSTLDDPNWVPPNAPTSLNLAYSYNPTYALMLHDYDRAGFMPNVFIEGNYEGENLENGPHVTDAHDVRAQAYWSNLSGGTGQFYGNHWEVYGMDNGTWQTNLAGDQGAPQMVYVKTLFEARAWWQLVPDESHAVVTAGLGTCMGANDAQGTSSPNAQDNTCATTARTPDGHLVMTYMPTARTITVDMSTLAAASTARWFDPTTGAFTAVSSSPVQNSGTSRFTPPATTHDDGASDWVLVLEN